MQVLVLEPICQKPTIALTIQTEETITCDCTYETSTPSMITLIINTNTTLIICSLLLAELNISKIEAACANYLELLLPLVTFDTFKRATYGGDHKQLPYFR